MRQDAILFKEIGKVGTGKNANDFFGGVRTYHSLPRGPWKDPLNRAKVKRRPAESQKASNANP